MTPLIEVSDFCGPTTWHKTAEWQNVHFTAGGEKRGVFPISVWGRRVLATQKEISVSLHNQKVSVKESKRLLLFRCVFSLILNRAIFASWSKSAAAPGVMYERGAGSRPEIAGRGGQPWRSSTAVRRFGRSAVLVAAARAGVGCKIVLQHYEPASDIDTVGVDGLKVLDPKRPIREGDIVSVDR